jgi:hypothetical protein
LNSEEVIRRYKIFNVKYKLTQESNSSVLPDNQALNELSDLTDEDFLGRSESLDMGDMSELQVEVPSEQVGPVNQKIKINWSSDTHLPRYDDYRCYECYSIAAVMEALLKIKYSYDAYLSVAHLKECKNNRKEQPYLDYVKNTGLVLETMYPNSKIQGTCDNKNLFK